MSDFAIQANRLFLELDSYGEALFPCGRFLGSEVAGEGEVPGSDARLWVLCLKVPSLPPPFPPPFTNGRSTHSLGRADVSICLGNESVMQHCSVLDTHAFDIVIGTDFLRKNPQVKMLSLQHPYALHSDFGSGHFSVPLELSGQKESGMCYAARTNYRTENYQLARHVVENGLAALQVSLNDIQAELLPSQHQHFMQLFCSNHLDNAFRFL